MRREKKESGFGSTATIIVLLIIVLILGGLFYLRSNNLIEVEGGGIKFPTLEYDEPQEREPHVDVKNAVNEIDNSRANM